MCTVPAGQRRYATEAQLAAELDIALLAEAGRSVPGRRGVRAPRVGWPKRRTQPGAVWTPSRPRRCGR